MAKRTVVGGNQLEIAAGNSEMLLRPLADLDWRQKAFRMTWTCRYTLDHVLNCLAWYAHDLAGEVKGPIGAGRAGFPRGAISDLLDSLEPLATVLSLVAQGKPASARAFHDWGEADPEGFIAMGTVEITLHTWDIVKALDPDRADKAILPTVADVLLPRLFPDAPQGHDPVPTLLYVTGRSDLGDRPRIRRWQWHSAPVD
jgi:hypothetical protein